MRTNTHQRTMTPREKKVIEQFLDIHPCIFDNPLGQVIKDVVSSIKLVLVLGSLIMALLYSTGLLTDVWELKLEATFIAFVMICHVVKEAYYTVKRSNCLKKVFLDELKLGKVIETHCQVVDFKIGQPVDDELIIYFLLLDDNRVFALWDNKDNAEPFELSNYSIASNLIVAQSKLHDFDVGIYFSGHPIQSSGQFTLSDNSQDWPEFNDFCDVQWRDIENHFKK